MSDILKFAGFIFLIVAILLAALCIQHCAGLITAAAQQHFQDTSNTTGPKREYAVVEHPEGSIAVAVSELKS